MLIAYLYDFMFDGYKVLRLKDITNLRRDEVDEFHYYIIQQQGMLNDLNRLEGAKIDSWSAVFGYLRNRGQMIDISLEKVEDQRNFFVGKVEEVQGAYLLFREVTVLGVPKRRRKKIYYKDITMISFGNRYAEMLDQ